ncbi:hypothetical protein [Tardiphaga alba]|uniref:hypothetical protein n=1 Tax=Tardiphaga alba TaxID=340268 RepID=UPI001BABBF6E|nr:hypothetical protein [Tardiphaga alba]
MTNSKKKHEPDQPKKQDEKISPAGTHDKPELTDDHKTPGGGMLSDNDHSEVEGPTG